MRDRQSAALYIGAAVCALLFALLAVAVAAGSTAAFDAAVRNQIHAQAGPALTQAARLFSFAGSAKLWVPGLAVALAACWLAGERKRALGLAAVMAAATLLDNGLKLAFHRVRPEVFFGALPDTFSFPSGHALFGLCFYGALAAVFASGWRSTVLRIAIRIALALLILGIGLSRIYLGVHYPTDVLAGFLAGGACLSAVCAAGLLQRVPPPAA